LKIGGSDFEGRIDARMRLIELAVILTLSLILAPLAAQEPQPGKLYRIGFLGNSTAALEAHLVGPFRDGCVTSATRRAETP
jgi:hypothetical protein